MLRERRRPEIIKPSERSLAPHSLNALRGKVIPVEGTPASVVIDGSGMFGLTNWADNKKWSGIFHHSLLTGRIAEYLSQQMLERGFQTNPQRIINTMVFSHAGRRAWEDARDFPETINAVIGQGTAQDQTRVTNEVLGLRIIKDKVPPDEFNLVAALAHDNTEVKVDPAIYESLDYRLTSYVDHRTTHVFQPLHTRMAGFLIANYFDGGKVPAEKQTEIEETILALINQKKQFLTGNSTTDISSDDANTILGYLGAHDSSARLTDRRHLADLILQDAETEAQLEQAGIDLHTINAHIPPMPTWEDQARKEYVLAAQEDLQEVFKQITSYDNIPEIIAASYKEFPDELWSTNYIKPLLLDYLNRTTLPPYRLTTR
ncbi:MAG TPA: hypothetical protein VLF20_03275 [Patescibacteria group bacterium]|nr:hypothetical protein [Patescibacteria group bacterium]